ncbi:MAG: hypothetical protein JOZ24_07030 [Candidatus Eremiobacteraeota bacterium]|nr:hypothetical protein [Candidatus Eremiobacteraeota bacterium]
MERRDFHQDDVTEERYPSPVRRDEAAHSQTLDPDASADDGNRMVMPDEAALGAKPALGYPDGVPGGVKDDRERSQE